MPPTKRFPTIFYLLGFVLAQTLSLLFMGWAIYRVLEENHGWEAVQLYYQHSFWLSSALGILGGAFFWAFLHNSWETMQPYGARTTPAMAVGGLFIPFYNIYQAFVSMVGLCDDGNRALYHGQIHHTRFPRGFAITAFIFLLLSFLPFLGLFWIIFTAIYIGLAGKALNSLPPSNQPIGGKPPVLAFRWHLPLILIGAGIVWSLTWVTVFRTMAGNAPPWLILVADFLWGVVLAGIFLIYIRPLNQASSWIRLIVLAVALFVISLTQWFLERRLGESGIEWPQVIVFLKLIAFLAAVLTGLAFCFTLRISFPLTLAAAFVSTCFLGFGFDTVYDLHNSGIEGFVNESESEEGVTHLEPKAWVYYALLILRAVIELGLLSLAVWLGSRKARWDSWFPPAPAPQPQTPPLPVAAPATAAASRRRSGPATAAAERPVVGSLLRTRENSAKAAVETSRSPPLARFSTRPRFPCSLLHVPGQKALASSPMKP